MKINYLKMKKHLIVLSIMISCSPILSEEINSDSNKVAIQRNNKGFSFQIMEKNRNVLVDYQLQYKNLVKGDKGFRIGFGLVTDYSEDKGKIWNTEDHEIYGYYDNVFDCLVQINFQYLKYFNSTHIHKFYYASGPYFIYAKQKRNIQRYGYNTTNPDAFYLGWTVNVGYEYQVINNIGFSIESGLNLGYLYCDYVNSNWDQEAPFHYVHWGKTNEFMLMKDPVKLGISIYF